MAIATTLSTGVRTQQAGTRCPKASCRSCHRSDVVVAVCSRAVCSRADLEEASPSVSRTEALGGQSGPQPQNDVDPPPPPVVVGRAPGGGWAGPGQAPRSATTHRGGEAHLYGDAPRRFAGPAQLWDRGDLRRLPERADGGERGAARHDSPALRLPLRGRGNFAAVLRRPAGALDQRHEAATPLLQETAGREGDGGLRAGGGRDRRGGEADGRRRTRVQLGHVHGEIRQGRGPHARRHRGRGGLHRQGRRRRLRGAEDALPRAREIRELQGSRGGALPRSVPLRRQGARLPASS